MGFWGALVDHVSDFDSVSLDPQTRPTEVEILDAESDRFGPTDAGVSQDEHEDTVRSAREGEFFDLTMSEVHVAGGHLAGQADLRSSRRVYRDTSIKHCVIENGREDAEGTDDNRRSHFLGTAARIDDI